MERKNFYDDATYSALLDRISRVTGDAQPQWGKMNAAQMCAHCTEVAEVSNGKALLNTPWYVRMMGEVIKKMVVSERPYPRSSKTHPQFEIGPDADFEEQQARLLGVLATMHSAGPAHAAAIRHPLFGSMTGDEYGWLTYKHLDHHLTQFDL